MMELLQEKEKLLLHELAGLKLNCLETEVCKIGFPIMSLEKYTDILEENKISYIVYSFDKQKEELEILKNIRGKRKMKYKKIE